MRCFWHPTPHEAMTDWHVHNFDMPRTYSVPRTYLSKIHKAHTLLTWQAQHTPHHDTTDPLEISGRNISHQSEDNEVVNPLLAGSWQLMMSPLLALPKAADRRTWRRGWQEIGWDRMCTASRQQRSLLVLLLQGARLDHQARWWLCPDSGQRSCRCSQKNGSRKTGISALLWWVDPLWYFAIMGVWWVDLLCMIGSQWFWSRKSFFRLAISPLQFLFRGGTNGIVMQCVQ
jgi:hypothetical protein